MVDVVFPLTGGALCEDHACALSVAVCRALPWLEEDPESGILPVTGLSSGGVRFVGPRSRLALRVASRRVASADSLRGARLDLDGTTLEVGESKLRPLFPTRVVHSHFVTVGIDNEIEFMARCRTLLERRGLKPQMIAGKARELQSAGGPVRGFSLLLHGLEPLENLALQEAGLGDHHLLGCGIFIPHKGVAAVGD